MNSLNVKKGDTVVVISGKDKGKKGKIMVSQPDDERVIVQGAAMVTRHIKPRKQGQPGGRIDITALRVVGRGRLDWTPPAARSPGRQPGRPGPRR